MILIIREPKTKTKVIFTDVQKIENEEDFGLNIWLNPNNDISKNNSPYKMYRNSENNFMDNPSQDKNKVYFSAVENPEDQNESFDTTFEVFTENGVRVDSGQLTGFKEE